MSKYCKYCGEKIAENEKCSCPEAQKEWKKKQSEKVEIASWEKWTDTMKNRMGFQTAASKIEGFELSKKIVPDCIHEDTGEIPIRQYHIASLRSLFKGMYAEGRLQVTNKRVLFRAAGISFLGTTELQHEFAIEEIAGIEIRRDHRIGFFHFFFALLLASIIMDFSKGMFEKFSMSVPTVASIFAVLCSCIAASVFFGIKKKFICKLALLSFSVGALVTVGFDTMFFIIPVSNGTFYTIISSIIALLFVLNLMLIAFVPNLVIEIKTKSASSPIEIRRKESNGILAFLFNMPKKDYTGFADVMPAKDTQRAGKELGAMINDIKVFGDEAITKWKEDITNTMS